MASTKPATFLEGWRLLLRHPSLFFWVYLVNLVLAWIGTRGFARRIGAVLNHSLIADRLVYGFDLGVVTSLRALPGSAFGSPATGLLGPSFVFTVFLLFITGGLLVTYYNDAPLSIGPFFEACGHYFWRFVRLMISFAVLLVPLLILAGLGLRLFGRIDDRAVSPFTAVIFMGVALAGIVVLLMCVRLWFDMAQVIAVAEDEPRMRKALRRAAGLLRQNFGSLFWLYFRISLLGWIGFGAGVRIWMSHIRPESINTAILLGQLSILIWLGTRLWQRASEARWYRLYWDAQTAESPAPATVVSSAVFGTPAES
ncbi:MAG TPA: hypothetical protein VEG64_14735 [Candidatus Sulfotelmatobacter sp.]|nr:hypothetical protein [Candidatus Sulfotelmatobacter sp.]